MAIHSPRRSNMGKEIMGISKVVGCAATVLFSAAIYLKKSGFTYMPIPLLVGALVGYSVSIASHPSINLPALLGKRSDGSFPLWAKFIFGPYLVSVRLYAVLKRLKRRESLYNEVSENLYVGGWPTSPSQMPPGDPVVIDCTCELPKGSFINKDAYFCIPLWDSRSPSPAQIESAARWACQKRAEKKPIYIHCANGHGRSVCVMCALLVELGVAESWKDAEKMIREKRPFIRMNAHHRKNLEEWTKQRITSKTG
ncbi:hypothetical protein C4D60_Mb10t18570 [Musa balbisiana]|uniref:Tyrosine specific protein phosphatases domain-containing protein n=1 Tax=Musa balbisiana TaxID=52838 RepID=A0A4S8J0L1_MUSBA|nr:hypothetical protein C4D60_Mb10t18570 [Musa balbisiana]